jgi:3-keto-5-aminohexanoate cleavage enzyme
MEKLIITAALTGAQQGKSANPHLPEQPDEIIQQAVEAWRAGAAIVHIHARDKVGKPTADVGIFREICEGIRRRCDAVINLSTGGAVAGLSLEERIRVIPALKPEIASFSVGGGALVGRFDPEKKQWTRDQFVPLVRSYAEMEQIARVFWDNGVKPELEVYSTAFLHNVWMLEQRELLQEPLLVNLVTNIAGECTPWSAKNILFLVESLPPHTRWMVTAIGGHAHFVSAAFCIAIGGHVRVGLEDNVYISKGVLAKSNAEMVEKAVRIAKEIGREIATPSEARVMLKLRQP